jgi:hypothetical protein
MPPSSTLAVDCKLELISSSETFSQMMSHWPTGPCLRAVCHLCCCLLSPSYSISSSSVGVLSLSSSISDSNMMATATSCRRWHDTARTLPGNQFRHTPPRRAGSLCWRDNAGTRMLRCCSPGNHPGNQKPAPAAAAYAGGEVMVGDPLSPTLRRGPGVCSERTRWCRILYGGLWLPDFLRGPVLANSVCTGIQVLPKCYRDPQ